MSTIEIRQHKSAIGEKIGAKRTLQALGLRHPGATVTHEDSVTVRGMVRRVAHLVDVRPGPASQGQAEPLSKEKR